MHSSYLQCSEGASSRLLRSADDDKIGHSESGSDQRQQQQQQQQQQQEANKQLVAKREQQSALRSGLRKGAIAQGALPEPGRIKSNNVGGSCVSAYVVNETTATTGSNNELARCRQRATDRNRAASNNNSNKSNYSNLFRQYLPSFSLLNLNSAGGSLADAANDSRRREQQSMLVSEKGEREVKSHQQVAKSIVGSALSRFKLSATRTGAQLAAGHHRERRATVQVEGASSLSGAIGQEQSQVKRKGFLYLKTSEAVKSLVRDINNNYGSNQLHQHNHELVGDQRDKTYLLSEESESGSESELEGSKDQRPQANDKSKQTMSSEKRRTCLQAAACLALVGLVALATSISPVLGQQHFPSGARSHPRDQPVVGQRDAGQAAAPQQQQQRPLPQPAAGSLVANINCNKIRGHVTLTPNLQGGTTVSTQISAGPPGEVYQWSVHQFPVKPGAAMCGCSALILGTKLIDLSEMHGNLPSEQEFSVQSSLNLFGAESPVGHSLLLRGIKTGMVACATFLPTRAKFHTPLSGSVTIFQTAFGTSFISHLMYSNGTRRHSMHRFDLLKSDDDIVAFPLQGSSQSTGAPQSAASSNQLLLEQREHEDELQACKRFSNGEPLFKNISYQLSVSTENFGMRGRTAMVLPPVPFETFSSVYLVIYSEHDPMEPIACAPLKFVRAKTAAAKFQSVSVQGSVVFSQESPYDVTLARVNLQMPNSDGHSYGIDELPMIIRRKSDTRVCPNIREIIYNPHHIEPSSVPPEGEATSDQYAVGDLSGKYGSLTGKATEKIQVNDYNLPLFGPASIVGRAMTVYSADGVAIACSNVELTTPMTTAFATFDFGIQGQFIFRQPQGDCNGDTYVYIEVSKPTGSSSAATQPASTSPDHGQHSRSLDHNWHVHVNPVDSGLDHLSTTDCAPAGPHFNPYNTSTSSIYSRDCTPFNVLRCELGDLSSKMFTIEIPPYRVKGGQEPDIGKFFGTDIDLPLCGPVSIVNRSVVVHHQDFGAQRLACSTIIEFKPRQASS